MENKNGKIKMELITITINTKGVPYGKKSRVR